MRHAIAAIAVVAIPLALMLSEAGSPRADPPAWRDAPLIVEDVARFWEAFDALPAAADPVVDARILHDRYLAPGTDGLKEFTRLRIGKAEDLARTIRARPRYYAAIRENTARVASFEPAIRAGYERLAELFPKAEFPPVYFLIGRLNSGGTLTGNELLIGLEMMAADDATPRDELGAWERSVIGGIERVPCYVLHELIHFQQRIDATRDLLAQAFAEGSADFLAELAVGCHLNGGVHAWALPREADLWREFSAVMHGDDTTGWLYGGDANRERPADVGYFIGYRIARAYYERSSDKQRAVADILRPASVQALLEASGYAGSLTP